MAILSHNQQGTEARTEFAARGGDDDHFLQRRIAVLTDELRRLQREYAAQLEEKQVFALYLRHVLDGLPVAVVVLDGNGMVKEHNRAAAALFSAPLLAHPWRETIARDFRPQAAAGHDLILNSGRVVMLSSCPLGKEPGQILLFQDVTDMRRAQDYLARQQRLLDLGQTAANLAHQIRTPLASALLYASHLGRDDLPPDTQRRFAGKTMRSLKQLESLVANMLLFARGEVGAEEQVRAGDLLGELYANTESLFAGTSVCYEKDDACDASLIKVNRTLILSALQNLVNNAAHAVNGDGHVVVYCRCSVADTIEFGVRDNGPGVAYEMQGRIFEPFNSTRNSGTGLGLTIVRAIARAHHGEAWFHSVPGDTVFAIRLPILASMVEDGELTTHDRSEVA